jgi:hypothetical protein
MKSYPAPPIPPQIIDQMRTLASTGASLEAVIQQMRDSGLSIVPSIRLIESIFGLAPSDAKRIVHLSRAWQDTRSTNDALHESALSAAKELGLEDNVESAQMQAIA